MDVGSGSPMSFSMPSLMPAKQSEIAVELARHVAGEFASRFRSHGPELAGRYKRKHLASAA